MADTYDFDAPVYLTEAERMSREKAWQVFLEESGTHLYITSEPTKLAAKVAFWRAWSLAHSNRRSDAVNDLEIPAFLRPASRPEGGDGR